MQRPQGIQRKPEQFLSRRSPKAKTLLSWQSFARYHTHLLEWQHRNPLAEEAPE
jgi:hypothetical protein